VFVQPGRRDGRRRSRQNGQGYWASQFDLHRTFELPPWYVAFLAGISHYAFGLMARIEMDGNDGLRIKCPYWRHGLRCFLAVSADRVRVLHAILQMGMADRNLADIRAARVAGGVPSREFALDGWPQGRHHYG
jgi:hypothetical protein